MKSAVALVLTAMLRTAAADGECKPAGGVLFEIQRADQKARLSTTTARLYENGAWTTGVIDVDGKRAGARTGCLQPDRLADLRVVLRKARWKTTPSRVSCRADQPRSTHYKWKGRLLYTERTCTVDVLDTESRAALDLVEYYLLRSRPERWDATECATNPLAKTCM